MPTLDELRKQIPDELNGLDDTHALSYIRQVYHPERSIEELSKALKVPLPAAPTPTLGQQLKSGFSRSFEEVPGLAAGVGGYVADAVGATSTRDSLMDYAKRKNDALAEKHKQDASSFTDAWDGKVGWLDFLANSAGYVAGQALQSLATGGVGALGGKMIARQGAKEIAEAAAAKAIAGGASEEVAKDAAKAAVLAAEKRATIGGAAAGAGGHNLGMELGSIYPDAVEQAQKEGRELDAGDMTRIFAAASLAAGVDTAGEAIMASRVLKGSAKPGGLMARAAKEVPAGMLREGATEAIQTGIEQYGAAKPYDLREIVDSAAVGAVGGGLGGAAAATHQRPGVDHRIDPDTPERMHEQADAAFNAIGTADSADAAIDAFTKSQLPLIPPAGPDSAGAEARAAKHELNPWAPSGGGFDKDTGEIAPFSDRLAEVKAAIADTRTRQQIRDTSGPKALNDIMWYVQQAGNASLPGKTSDRMLALAERMLLRAQTTPIDAMGGPGGQSLMEQAQTQAQIPLDMGDTGRMIVGSDGTVTGETNADRISLMDRARNGATVTPPPGPVASATPGNMIEPAGAQVTANTPSAAAPAPAETGNVPSAAAPRQGQFATFDEARAYLSRARQGATIKLPKALPFEHEDGSVDVINEGQPRFAEALEQQEQRDHVAMGASVDSLAHEAAPSPQNDRAEPTDGQKEANNYKHGKLTISGLRVSIENPAGSTRSGVDPDGTPWSNTLNHHYGYIRGTVGNDDEHLDAFIRPGTPTDWRGNVYVIDQFKKNGEFDEHKILIGFDNMGEAKGAYLSNYAHGWDGGKGIKSFTFDRFKKWINEAKKKTTPLSKKGQNPSDDEASNDGEPGVRGVAARQEAVQRSEGQGLPSVRSGGRDDVPGVDGQLRDVPGARGAQADAGALDRPRGGGAGLPAGQRALGDEAAAVGEPAGLRARADRMRKNADGGGVGAGKKTGAGDAVRPPESRDDGREGLEPGEAPPRRAGARADAQRKDRQPQGVGKGNRPATDDAARAAETRLDARKGADSEIGTGDKPAPGKSETPQITRFGSYAHDDAIDDKMRAAVLKALQEHPEAYEVVPNGENDTRLKLGVTGPRAGANGGEIILHDDGTARLSGDDEYGWASTMSKASVKRTLKNWLAKVAKGPRPTIERLEAAAAARPKSEADKRSDEAVAAGKKAVDDKLKEITSKPKRDEPPEPPKPTLREKAKKLGATKADPNGLEKESGSKEAERLRERATRLAAATAADKAEQKRLADKAKADAERGEFTLTGSDRPADVAAAAGQGDIFAGSGTPTVADLMGTTRRYASGLSRVGDLAAGGAAVGGLDLRGVGVDVGELSANAIKTMANAIVNQKAAVFVDSGAFGAFKRGLKSGDFTPMDFDAVFERYDRILDAIAEANPAEETDYPRPMLVMPDKVGDQQGSMDLLRQRVGWIKANLGANLARLIVPIQKGEGSMADAYREVVALLGRDNFIVGIPSNAEAVSRAEFTEFLRDAKPKAVHVLGAASDARLSPRLQAIIDAGRDGQTEVTADASPVRNEVLRAVAKGAKRGDAIGAALFDTNDPANVRDREEEAKRDKTLRERAEAMKAGNVPSAKPETTGTATRIVTLDKDAAGKLSIAAGESPAQIDATAKPGPEHYELGDRLRTRLNTLGKDGGPVYGRRAEFDAVGIGGAREAEMQATATAAKRLFGHEVVFIKTRSGSKRLFNGAMSDAIPGTVFVDVETKKPMLAVLGHELLHQLRAKNPEIYRDLQARLNEVIQNEDRYRDRLGALHERIGSKLPADWMEELHADIVGDRFLEPGFWQKLGEGKERGLFMRVLDAVKRFLDATIAKLRGFGTEEFISDLEEAQAAVAEAMRAFSQSRTEGTGDGLAMSAAPPTEPFYSAFSEAVTALPMKSGDASAWMQAFKGMESKGVKRDEIAWSGIEEWLQMQPGKVPKAEVQAFLDANGVRVTETVLGGESESKAANEQARLSVKLNDFIRENDLPTMSADELISYLATRHEALTDDDQNARDVDDQAKVDLIGKQIDWLQDFESDWNAVAYADEDARDDETRYGTYTLPGGTNYREMLLTLPPIERPDASGQIPFSERYRSSHWGQENILAHIRMNDRTDADGKKVLFVEEIQSDWAQEGKRKGFGNPNVAHDPTRLAELERIADDRGLTEAQNDEFARLRRAAQGFVQAPGVPPAPFVGKTDAWVALALKRAIKVAVDGGYDKVAFVNGQQSADRYGLEKQVSSIEWTGAESDRMVTILTRQGNDIEFRVRPDGSITGVGGRRVGSEFDGKMLDEVVGKEIAGRIMAERSGALSGNGLKVGGEGMKAFYDSIVPKVAKETLRKLGGGQMGTVVFPATPQWVGEFEKTGLFGLGAGKGKDHPQPGFDITPALRAKAESGVPLFSIADDAAGNVPSETENNVARGVRGFSTSAARNLFLDAVTSHGKTNLWERTIGTQYAKAQKNPHTFGRVFDAVQNYIQDTSTFANTAADRAPDILPKLESWRDALPAAIGGNKRADPADLKAAGAALWKGTLTDSTVYSPGQLRAMGLTDKQAELYRQARAAIDQSLDDMAKVEIVRLAGLEGTVTGMRAMAAPSAAQAADTMQAYLESQGDLQTAELFAPKLEQIEKLKAEGYAPLMRFGRHTLHITREGETEYFAMYESRLDANQAARELKEDPKFKGADFTQGLMSEQAYQLYQGLPLDALEVFAEATGNQDNPVYQDFLKLTKSNRSVLKRLIHRQGIAGFSEDTGRVLAAFITSNARYASGNLHLAAAKKLADAIPKEQGDLKDEAIKLLAHIQNPQGSAHAMSNLLYVQFIGGSVASAAVNLTQPFTMSLPYLSQFGGIVKAAGHLLAATRGAASGKVSDEMQDVLDRHTDVVSPQEIHHLTSEAMSRLNNHPMLKKAAFLWSSMFSLSEQFNRRVTFIAAYNAAKQNGFDDPEGFARQAVTETQGLYNQGNKANLARGPIGGTILTFKQFSVHYLEFLMRMAKSGPEGRKAAAVALGILALTAGAGGLPFAEDIEDLVDTLAQSLGYNFSSKKAMREFVADTLGLGDEAALLATKGVSGLSGMPIDVSLRMGMGNLLPATGILLRSNTDRSKDVLEIAGAAGGLAKSLIDAAGMALRAGSVTDMGAAGLTMAPAAIQNMAKAANMMNTGEYRNRDGKKVIEVDGMDAAMKFIGFQPGEVAKESARMGETVRSIQLAKNVREEIATKLAQAINDRDADKAAEARDELRSWNENNPEAHLDISTQSLRQRVDAMRLTREQRTLKTAPAAMRRILQEETH